MAAQPERIYSICEALLAAVVAYYDDQGVALPARQYVSAGAPAWDCSLLATWCEGTRGYEGDPNVQTTVANPTRAGFAMRAGTFVVTVCRPTCAAPDIDGDNYVPPSIEEEQAAAAPLYADATLLLQALSAAVKAGDLPGCHSVAFLDWRVLGPEGLYVAGELRLVIGLSAGA